MRWLPGSIHCDLDPSGAAALCTREQVERLAAWGPADCRALTTGNMNPEGQTPLDEVPAALARAAPRFQHRLATGGRDEMLDPTAIGVRVTLMPKVSSRAERSPAPPGGPILLDLADGGPPPMATCVCTWFWPMATCVSTWFSRAQPPTSGVSPTCT